MSMRHSDSFNLSPVAKAALFMSETPEVEFVAFNHIPGNGYPFSRSETNNLLVQLALDDPDGAWALREYNHGVPVSELARRHNCSRRQVYRLLHRAAAVLDSLVS